MPREDAVLLFLHPQLDLLEVVNNSVRWVFGDPGVPVGVVPPEHVVGCLCVRRVRRRWTAGLVDVDDAEGNPVGGRSL